MAEKKPGLRERVGSFLSGRRGGQAESPETPGSGGQGFKSPGQGFAAAGNDAGRDGGHETPGNGGQGFKSGGQGFAADGNDAGQGAGAALPGRGRGGRRSGSPRMSYGSHGASTTLNSLIGWILDPGSAEDNIDLYSSILRQRSRDLYAGGGLGRSAPTTLSVSTVGKGVIPMPKIDGDFLGLSEEEAAETERAILREFRLWAESPMCDAERQKNFYEMQRLAFLSMLMSGDVFALFGMKPNPRTPYQTTLRILEADRVSTEGSSGESTSVETTDGGRIIDGVEINREGEVIRYWIASRSPIAQNDGTELVWKSIDAYGKDTGFPLILHVMVWERPEQRRGIPLIASEIETIKQLTRYQNSELAANVVSSMLGIFLTSQEDDGKAGMEDAISEEEKVTDDELHLELAPGAIYDLPPGKDVKSVNPIRTNTVYKDYVESLVMFSGSSIGIPKEVLIKKFESNYTAARAALLDFQRTVGVYRSRFVDQFCQPVYEQVLAEMVATGRIKAPGFFEDPLTRKAWSGCKWVGEAMGHVDPLKEINAAAARIANNVSTEEQEAAAYNGSDWTENIRQRKRELEKLAELRKIAGTLTEQNGTKTPEENGEEDEE